jgi:hypothetical protein
MYATREALGQRQTFAAWHERYPRILPFVADYLRRYAVASDGGAAGGMQGTASTSTAHSALVPMLIIIRSLRWSEKSEEVQAELRDAVRPFLSSREWQVS